MAFAKLFETEDMGQILVMFGQSDECMPEVRTWVQPDGLMPSSMAFQFPDDVEGEKLAMDLFGVIDIDAARRTAKMILDAAEGKGFPGGEGGDDD